MSKTLTEMAAEIVAAMASHAIKAIDEVSDALKKVFEALQTIQGQEEGVEAEVETKADKKLARLRTKPLDSIQRNRVVCLECGKEFKQLTSKHLQNHGMDAKAYRKKYGFKARQPLTAKTLTAKRRKTAKELGLGEKLQAARKTKAKAAPKPAAKKAVKRKKKT